MYTIREFVCCFFCKIIVFYKNSNISSYIRVKLFTICNGVKNSFYRKKRKGGCDSFFKYLEK